MALVSRRGWHSVADELPDDGRQVLVCGTTETDDAMRYGVASYDAKWEMFGGSLEVEMWHEIPAAPWEDD